MKLYNLASIGMLASFTLGACTNVSNGAATFSADYNAAFNFIIAKGFNVKTSEGILLEYRDELHIHKALWIADDGTAWSFGKETVQIADAVARKTCLDNSKATCHRVMLDDKFAGK